MLLAAFSALKHFLECLMVFSNETMSRSPVVTDHW